MNTNTHSINKNHLFLLLLFFATVFTARAQTYGNEWINYTQTYYKIKVTRNGIHRLDYNFLNNAGLSAANPQKLQLFRRGKEVALFVNGENDGRLDAGDYVEFYGERNDGKTDVELYKGDIGARGFHDDMEVLRTGEPLLDMEEFFYDEHGEKHWLLTSKVPVHNADGAITHLLGIGHNITARKKAEESLQEAYKQIKESNDTLRDLAWSNSHEIRKPVCSIFSLVDLLKQSNSEDERNQCLQLLERCAHELDDVIRRNSEKMNTLELGEDYKGGQ